MIELTIDPEFSTLCWPLDEDEIAELHASILGEGCRDPILYWKCGDKNIIVDGHNRHKFCTERGIEYRTQEMIFADRDSAHDWIIQNQLGRRNASAVQRRYLIGSLTIARRAAAEGASGRVLASIVDEVAKEVHTSRRQIYDDMDLTRKLDAMKEPFPKIHQAVVLGHVTAHNAELLCDLPPEIVARIETTPEIDLKTAIRAACKAARGPLADCVDFWALSRLGKLAANLGRTRLDAARTCGDWGQPYSKEVRLALVPLFAAIESWQRASQGKVPKK